MTESDAGTEAEGADTPGADDGRPISVAELLARNGTIGAPPAGGRRRRRRGNSAAVTVAELTGEIPVIRDEDPAPEPVDEAAVETVEDVESEEVETEYVETEDVESDEHAADDDDEGTEPERTEPEEPVTEESVAEEPVTEESESEDADETDTSPPLSPDPQPTKSAGPELAHDPRPVRRGLGAEEMAPDPVDQSVDLAGLVAGQDDDVEELRSYLQSSGGALFGGQSMADDLARRDSGAEQLPSLTEAGIPALRPADGRLGAARHAAIALGQSALAVVFGAGLFIAFDQLWRWNNLVALVLSVLVILGLVVAVRVVRKTEDIASTLIAVAVGALVTLGPLALLQST